MLAFENVTRVFHNGTGVFNLEFQLQPGRIVALIGLNGAGKTTLMRLALGMLRPQHGTVRLLGHPVDAIRPEAWCRVGTLIEAPAGYPELTARENLLISSLLHGTDTSLLRDSLRVWELESVAERRFRHLSQGTRQRVGLASALQHDPGLVVLDEPGSSLDPASVILLRDQLTRRARQGAAVLVSSHHLDEVSRIADRVLLMNAGRLIGELDTTGSDLERRFFEHIRADDERRREKRKHDDRGRTC